MDQIADAGSVDRPIFPPRSAIAVAISPSMGPSSALAAVAASAVLVSGLTDQGDIATFVAGITLASGVLFLVLFLLRMGWIAQFLSRAARAQLEASTPPPSGSRSAED
jgi:hypothetical protein